MQHPVTTEIKSTTVQIAETIKAIKKFRRKKLKVIFWPNVDEVMTKFQLC